MEHRIFGFGQPFFRVDVFIARQPEIHKAAFYALVTTSKLGRLSGKGNMSIEISPVFLSRLESMRLTLHATETAALHFDYSVSIPRAGETPVFPTEERTSGKSVMNGARFL